MGLHKQYLKVGQNARNQLFGLPKGTKTNKTGGGSGNATSPLSMLISQGVTFNNSKLIFQN